MSALGSVAPAARPAVAHQGERRVGGPAPCTRLVFRFGGQAAGGGLQAIEHPDESGWTDD